MKKSIVICTLALFAGVVAHASVVSTTISVSASGPFSGTSIALSGTALFSPAVASGVTSGAFSSTVPLSSISGTNVTAPFTITFSGTTGTLTGSLTLPVADITSGSTSASGAAAITGGTGTFVDATGSFTLTGSGSLNTTSLAITVNFSGPGTINTVDSTGGGTGTGAGGGSAPVINAVLDAGSYTSNIAQGSIFVIKGTNLSASGFIEFGFPLPSSCTSTLCNGASSGQITFTPTTGGSAIQAYLVYLYNQSGVNQLAAILPSSAPTGVYNVTVTNNTGVVSAPFSVTVVARKIGLITQDGSGSGLAVVQNYVSAGELDVNRFTTGAVSGVTISPAHPGQTLIAWATGFGAVPTSVGADNTASPGYDFSANGVTVQVLINGVAITPLYAGRAPGLAGADQINFILPSNIPTGCTASLEVSVNGVLSNQTFLSIAPDATSTTCVLPGFTSTQLQNFDNGGTITAGSFAVTQFSIAENIPSVGETTAKIDSASGAFTQYTGFQLAGYQNYTTPTGACILSTTSSSSVSLVTSVNNLDAGNIQLTGPSGSGITNLALQETSNAYNVSIATEISGIFGIPGQTNSGTVIAGTYKLAGGGGMDVGPFNAQMTLGVPLTITGGLPSAVTRANGLTLNWTGGSSNDIVVIAGASSGSGDSGISVEFVCTTTAGKGTFTVPASILNQLPASVASSVNGGSPSGFLIIDTAAQPTSGNGLFSAPLTAGGSVSGTFLGLVGTGAALTYN